MEQEETREKDKETRRLDSRAALEIQETRDHLRKVIAAGKNVLRYIPDKERKQFLDALMDAEGHLGVAMILIVLRWILGI